ncbi:MAG: type II secretion system protein [Candidatus Paceibacterota bacterium]
MPCSKYSFYKRGMSYVELIVVLSIFATLSSVVIFNHGDFQDRVDIKNLASDIALKIIEAQKSSVNGVMPPLGHTPDDPDNWKPAYGVYFDITSNDKQFVYFTDLDKDNTYSFGGELLDTIDITKNNFISNIDTCSVDPCALGSESTNLLSITFTRLNSGASFDGATLTGSDYIQIAISSPKGATALVKVYPSGRVRVN